ncbi:MAG TPA: TIGR03915 family putative DNA repair protein [Rubricoccaceae bacterium]|jgi:probable DNA metabolism protein
MSGFSNPGMAPANRPTRAATAYRYDGTFDGFLGVVFEATRRRETPASISRAAATLELGPVVDIETDFEIADRVRRGLDRRGPEASARLYAAFLSEEPGVEHVLFRLILDLIERGASALGDWRSEPSREAHRLSARTWREVHRMHAFVRFERRGEGVAEHYVACVRPGPHALPLLTDHFAARFPTLRWAIVDTGRRLALVHTPASERDPEAPPTRLVPSAEIDALVHAPDEAHVQRMWQAYFRAVDIPERKNLALQQRHIPKRYRADMTEMRDSTP